MLSVNWIAVVIATAFNMVLGTLWYGPFFGKLWLKLIGKTREDISKDTNPAIFMLPIITGFVSALVLAVIVGAFGVSTWYGGLLAGLVVWIGIGMTNEFVISIYEDRKFSLWLLYGFYQVIVFAAEGVLFALWK